MEEVGKRVFDSFGGVFEIYVGELFDKFGDIVGGAGEGGMRQMVDAVA